MLRLLRDVEAGSYAVGLCMDLDCLSRGRIHGQGIILDTFRDSDTLIVTPEKTHDLADELDDEMAEFKTLLFHREYKIINKRLLCVHLLIKQPVNGPDGLNADLPLLQQGEHVVIGCTVAGGLINVPQGLPPTVRPSSKTTFVSEMVSVLPSNALLLHVRPIL